MVDLQSLARFSFFDGADPAALGLAAQASHTVTAEAGALVLDYGDPGDGVFCIIGGALRIVIRAPNGAEVVLGDLGAGDILGEMSAVDGAERSASATALCRTTLVRVPAEPFIHVALASPPVGRRLLRLLVERVRAKDLRILELTVLPVRLRLCSDLLRLARRLQDGRLSVSPPVPQHVMGARIGARREAVSRELTALERGGFVAVSRRGVTLLDPSGLGALVRAGFEAHDRRRGAERGGAA